MLPLMWVFWVSVWNHHLRERQSVKNRPNIAFIIVCDVVEDDSLLVIESNVNVPILPTNDSSVHLERHSFWLCDVDRLNIRPVASFRLNAGWMVVVRLCLVDWPADFWDINVDYFLLVEVEDRAEVQGEGVLAVVYVRSVVHECLLKSHAVSESVIIANCPSCGDQQTRSV